MADSTPLPSSDAMLAALLATWGHAFDERQRVKLRKRDAAVRNEIDRVVKYTMPELRRLAGSQASQQDLRALLGTHFQLPQGA